ncbi:MAG TPA: hypothetical protein VM241_00010 [Candidatus Thermoplasmatota archaeon]|nr:hypothetical protein [Candidatus Thermoplasmatota archaeon]
MERAAVARAYFLSERRAALLLLVLGAASLGLAVRLSSIAEAVRWAGVPLALFGALEVAAGARVLVGARRRLHEAEAGLADPGGAWLGRERQRIAGTLRRLRAYGAVEALLVLLGVALGYEGGAAGRAVGIAVAAEAALLLGMDGVARRRALAYLRLLA